jgi:hypothetical protein
MKPIHTKRSPELQPLLKILNAYSLQYVITGSVAVLCYGVELEPGDFDITPALNKDNLNKLADILMEIEATPESLGHWETKSNGEKKWIELEASPEMLVNWKPELEKISTFDHLYHTRYGNFDVVPELAGDYETLMQDAEQKELFGYWVWVAHIDNLLAKLTVPRREKDIPRVNHLREIQRTRRLN